MTISTVIQVIPTTATDDNVDCFILDQTKLKLLRKEFPDSSTTRALYKYVDADPTVFLTVSSQATSAPKLTKWSIILTAPISILNDVQETETPGGSAKVTIIVEVPTGTMPSLTYISRLVSTAFGLTFPSVSSGAPSTSHLLNAMSGVAAVYGG